MMMALRYGCVCRAVLGVDDMALGLPFDVDDSTEDESDKRVGEVGGDKNLTLVDARERR